MFLFCCYHLMVVIGSSLPQIHMHCFSNRHDFAVHLFTHFPNFTSDRRNGTHSFLPFPSHPVSPQYTAQGSSDAKRSLPAPPLALCYRHPVVFPYGDDNADSGVCNEARRGMVIGGECLRFDAVVLGAYMECPALTEEDRRRYPW